MRATDGARAWMCALLGVLIATTCCACAMKRTDEYFGTVPLATSSKLATALGELEQPGCPHDGERCKAGDDVGEALYGRKYYPEWPKLLVYVKRGGSVVQPVLLWNGRNTAHLHGAKNMFVIVMAEEELRLEARMTTLTPKWVNPFLGLLNPLQAPAEKREKEVEVGELQPIRLRELEGPKPTFWYGATGFTLQQDTVSRISIRSPSAPGDPTAAGQGIDAHAVQANFSNTDGSWVGVSIGAGGIVGRPIRKYVTGKGDATTEAETNHLGAFLYGKVYLKQRPRLRVREGSSFFGPYQPSVALALGTNLSPTSAFNDFVVGLSIGHWVGRVGLVVGWEFTGARNDFFDKRQNGPFLGFDYSF